MKMFHEHEGKVYVRVNAETYVGTRSEFEHEFGEKLPQLGEGLERIYEPGVRHAIQNRVSVVDGGPREWEFGDRALDAIAKLKAAQKAREDKKAAEEEARIQTELKRSAKKR